MPRAATSLKMAQKMTPTRRTRRDDSFDREANEDEKEEKPGKCVLFFIIIVVFVVVIHIYIYSKLYIVVSLTFYILLPIESSLSLSLYSQMFVLKNVIHN